MTKAIQRNITALEAVYDNYKKRFNRATKEKVRNILDLYSERKIAQFTTADNLIRNLSQPRHQRIKKRQKNNTTRFMTNIRINPDWVREWKNQSKKTRELEGQTQERKLPILFQ